mmetsp:Transcript_6446/g.15958  ORF Transcript_6446/g.15958 Transcript_6446/m.15958 type:complete len:238 (+) Transcript_6446:1227-1940(+)
MRAGRREGGDEQRAAITSFTNTQAGEVGSTGYVQPDPFSPSFTTLPLFSSPPSLFGDDTAAATAEAASERHERKEGESGDGEEWERGEEEEEEAPKRWGEGGEPSASWAGLDGRERACIKSSAKVTPTPFSPSPTPPSLFFPLSLPFPLALPLSVSAHSITASAKAAGAASHRLDRKASNKACSGAASPLCTLHCSTTRERERRGRKGEGRSDNTSAITAITSARVCLSTLLSRRGR